MTSKLTLGWQPAHTWVIVVGTLVWKHSEFFDPFPLQNRRDAALVETFRALGVPAAQIQYLQDKQATTARITQTLETQFTLAKPGDLLILYYCGHGYKNDDGTTYFASYDADDEDNPGWLVEDIPEAIDRLFPGSSALLLVDCCYSGHLADLVTSKRRRIAYACLTSSLASELSTGNWTFTEGLIAGLRGQAFADSDGNRSITLGELAGQIADSMAFAEEQISTFVTTGNFDAQMILANAQPRTDPAIGRRVEALSEGEWYPAQIIETRGDQFKVHFYGYEDSDDEWVTHAEIRDVTRPAYAIGTAVEVKWKRKWYSASVLDVRHGIHHIRYDDSGPEWNEWVAQKRIRLAK